MLLPYVFMKKEKKKVKNNIAFAEARHVGPISDRPRVERESSVAKGELFTLCRYRGAFSSAGTPFKHFGLPRKQPSFPTEE